MSNRPNDFTEAVDEYARQLSKHLTALTASQMLVATFMLLFLRMFAKITEAIVDAHIELKRRGVL